MAYRPKIAVFDPAPFLASGDLDQSAVKRLFQHAAGREGDGDVSRLEHASRRLDRALEARRDQVLERADAVDDGVRLSALERGQRSR
jgi:hypothetical protein